MAENNPGSQSIGEQRTAIFDRIYAFYDLKVLAMTFEWDLVGKLAARAMTIAELAAEAKLPERSVKLLLQSLAAMTLVKQQGDKYAPTDKGARFMVSSSPECVRDVVRFAEWQFDSLPRLRETIHDEAITWTGFDHYLHNLEAEKDPELARERQRIFNAALAGSAGGTAKAVLTAVDFAGSKRMLDIGGNLGVFSATILEANPHLRSTVFDLPQVVPQTKAKAEERGLGDRIDTIGGDFVNDAWPEGHDLVTFIRIFATRERSEIVFLLKKAFAALPSGGRALFYEEHVAGPNREIPARAAWAPMFLVIGSKGELRTLPEWKEMFAEAGFTNLQGVTKGPWGVVVGTKP